MPVVNAYDIAQRFIGIKEIPGSTANPQVLAMLRLDGEWPADDSVPWCSAFVNYVCWLLRLPRSKSLSARSWLAIGRPVSTVEATQGDVVVLKRGNGVQPPADVLDAPGHVGFFAGRVGSSLVEVLGGNQGDTVSVQRFPVKDVLSIRRLT